MATKSRLATIYGATKSRFDCTILSKYSTKSSFGLMVSKRGFLYFYVHITLYSFIDIFKICTTINIDDTAKDYALKFSAK